MAALISDDFERRSLNTIFVPANRQRKNLELDEDFLASIKHWGVVQPIVVCRNGELLDRRTPLSGE